MRAPSRWSGARGSKRADLQSPPGDLVRRRALHAHRAEHLPNGRQGGLDVLGKEPADGADAEACRPSKLAGIDHETALAEARIELLETKMRIGGIAVGRDDGALVRVGQIGREADFAHAPAQRLMVAPVARAAA